MKSARENGLWRSDDIDIEKLTPMGFCDAIRACFTEAQKETLKFGQEKLGIWKDGDDVAGLVDGALRMAFMEVDCDIKNPTFEGCRKVLAVLAKGARSWGTPEEVIAGHLGEMNKLLVRLGLEPINLA